MGSKACCKAPVHHTACNYSKMERLRGDDMEGAPTFTFMPFSNRPETTRTNATLSLQVCVSRQKAIQSRINRMKSEKSLHHV